MVVVQLITPSLDRYDCPGEPMSRMNRATLALIVACLGCAGGTPGDPDAASGIRLLPPSEAPDIRGTITAIAAAQVRIEERPDQETGSAKASVRLLPTTRILRRSGGVAAPADLRVGQQASAWFEGPVAESYPVQAAARVLVVEP